MNHLETLVSEYLEWQGYLIRRNTKVGRLPHGGWAMELDVVGYHPHSNHLVHYEPSIDAHSWDVRESRFKSKFDNGRKYILSELFTWLEGDPPIDQVAICASRPKHREALGGGRIISVDEFVNEVRQKVAGCGPLRNNAISESYPLLRTLQLLVCGYQRPIS